MISGTIKVFVLGRISKMPPILSSCSTQAMLSGGFMESKQGEISFPEIKSAVLEKVIQYMYYKVGPDYFG